MREVVIASACRTAVGGFAGSLSGIPATDLGAKVITEAIARAGIKKEDVHEVIMGCVLPHGLGQNPARQAMIKASLPWDAGAITVNKVCGSGLKAVMLGAQAIQCGDADEIPLRPPKTSAEALAALKPAFKKEGKVTAGNASKISDGAAALVLTTLIYAMKDRGAEIGEASLCLGGGEAVTLVVYNEQ